MGNYSYTSNDINFSIPDNADYKFGKLSHEYTSLKRGDITPLINAVEIDWNNAYLGSYIINTTGQLLSH